MSEAKYESRVRCVVDSIMTRVGRYVDDPDDKGLPEAIKACVVTRLWLIFEVVSGREGRRTWPAGRVCELVVEYPGYPRHQLQDEIPGLYELIAGSVGVVATGHESLAGLLAE